MSDTCPWAGFATIRAAADRAAGLIRRWDRATQLLIARQIRRDLTLQRAARHRWWGRDPWDGGGS